MNNQIRNDLRFKATQYADAHLPVVNNFISELNGVGITHFCYMKVVENKSFMRFCPQNKWLRETFGGSMDEGLVASMVEKLDKKNKFTLWQSCFAKSSVGIVFDEIRKNNINHGIVLLKTNGEGISEFCNFASTNDNSQILDFYLNHLDLLEDAFNRFSQRMGKALDHTIPGRLEPLDSPGDKIISQHYPQKGVVISSFYGKDPVETLDVFLTEKQFACFDLLKKGYPTKQIAQILGKSPRTIDAHITVIFDKFGILSRHALIDLPVVIRRVG